MRLFIFSFVLLFVTVNGLANQKIYDKLNKLYLIDRNKCMEMSKKIASKKSNESIPFYFMSVIHYDKSKESRNLRGAYLQMTRSVSHAIKFEKLSSDKERLLVQWDEHISSLHQRADKLISALNRNELEDLSESLVKNLSKVESLQEYYVVEKDDILLTDNVSIKNNSIENTEKRIYIPEHFYGIPTGNERVNSNIELEKQMYELINKERIKRNLPAIMWNEDLAHASRYHAYDQGTQAYFSHVSNDRFDNELIKVGSTFDRIRKFYKGTIAGECIGAGNKSAEKTLELWLKSEKHANIILDPSTKYIGIGMVSVEDSPFKDYWVLATGGN